MKLSKSIGPSLGLLAGLSLVACGGGSSNNATPGGGPAPADPVAITAVGSITGFGSVFVNGTKYEVESDTVIAIEDELETMGDDSNLRLGMKVRVTASATNGVRSADRIEYDDDVEGPIGSLSPDGIDPSIGTFDVIGVTIEVDAKTVFDNDVGNNDGIAGIDFRDLAVGMVVEVSGYPTDNGFLATRVDREFDAVGGDPVVGDPDVDGDEIEIKGPVESVAADQVRVNGIDFSVDTGTIFEDGLMLNDDLMGMFVEVKADFLAGGGYRAVRIEREDGFEDEDHVGEFEIEGVLQAVDTSASPNTFTIIGITVPVTDASSLEALVGMRVEIKGSFNADDVLVLREAGQDIDDNVRTEDLVAMVDITAVNFTTRLGLVIAPTGGSSVQDDAEGDGGHLTSEQFVNRLQIGDRMESRGVENADGSVTWTRVERDETAANNNDFECELRGPISSIEGDAASFSFVIQGVKILTDSVADNNFEGLNDQPIGRAEFFANLQDDVVVQAGSFEGDAFCMPGTLDAREVELE